MHGVLARIEVVELVVAAAAGRGRGGEVVGGAEDAVRARALERDLDAADARLATVLQAVGVGVVPDPITNRALARADA